MPFCPQNGEVLINSTVALVPLARLGKWPCFPWRVVIIVKGQRHVHAPPVQCSLEFSVNALNAYRHVESVNDAPSFLDGISHTHPLLNRVSVLPEDCELALLRDWKQLPTKDIATAPLLLAYNLRRL